MASIFYNNDILLSFKSFTDSTDYLLSQCNFKNELDVLIYNKNKIPEITQDVIIPTVYNDVADNIDNINFIIMEFLDGKFPFDIIDEKERIQYGKMVSIYNSEP